MEKNCLFITENNGGPLGSSMFFQSQHSGRHLTWAAMAALTVGPQNMEELRGLLPLSYTK
jgi:hypothetical protein